MLQHCGTGPTDFSIPPSLAKETPRTNEREKHILKHWQKNKKSNQLRKDLHSCSDATIKFLCERAVNINIGNIQFPATVLQGIDTFASNHPISRLERRQAVSTAKGNKILQQIGEFCYLLFTAKDNYIKKQPRAMDDLQELRC